MSATKDYHHDLIEKQSRLYNVLELQKMELQQLTEIACNMNVTVAQAAEKQSLICTILNQQK